MEEEKEEENLQLAAIPNVKSPDFADFVKTWITEDTVNKYVKVHTNLRIFPDIIIIM